MEGERERGRKIERVGRGDGWLEGEREREVEMDRGRERESVEEGVK